MYKPMPLSIYQGDSFDKSSMCVYIYNDFFQWFLSQNSKLIEWLCYVLG